MEIKSKQICRFCLTTNRPLVNIYKWNTQDVPLSVQIISSLSLEVFPNDKMPNTICEYCAYLVDFSYRFRKMCHNAENALKMVPIKKVWPEPFAFPKFAEGAPFSLVEQTETFLDDGPLLEIITGTDTAPINSQPVTVGPAVIIKSEPYLEKLPMLFEDEETAEVTIPVQTQKKELPKAVPKGGPTVLRKKRPFEIKSEPQATGTPPKVLNKVSPKAVEEEPSLKRNKFGNVDIVLPPEVIPTNVFACRSCERSFPLRQLLEIHEKNHTREREATCELCDKKFFNKYDLLKHMVVHSEAKPFKCVLCEKSFSRGTLLHRHQKVHTDVPRFECTECDRFFFVESELETHTQKHMKARPFKCPYCPKSFAFKQGLERHELIHAASQPFPCEYCEASFNTASRLLKHLQAHSGTRPFPCRYCPRSYLMSHHLSRHLRSHARKPNVSVVFTCYRCKGEFESAQALVSHMYKVHVDLKDLKCPLCKVTQTDSEALQKHVKMHTTQDQFACEFCDLIFVDEESVMSHSFTAHKDDHRMYDEDVAKNMASVKGDEGIDTATEGDQHQEEPEMIAIVIRNDLRDDDEQEEEADGNKVPPHHAQISEKMVPKIAKLTGLSIKPATPKTYISIKK